LLHASRSAVALIAVVIFKRRRTQVSIFDFLFRKKKGLDAVPGALVTSYDGEVIYNMLTPHMQQFLGRCIGAMKKEGIKAKGTGQFSILLGENTQAEIKLSDYYKPEDDPELTLQVVAEAKRLTKKSN
jgi:hypothetical protein